MLRHVLSLQAVHGWGVLKLLPQLLIPEFAQYHINTMVARQTPYGAMPLLVPQICNAVFLILTMGIAPIVICLPTRNLLLGVEK